MKRHQIDDRVMWGRAFSLGSEGSPFLLMYKTKESIGI